MSIKKINLAFLVAMLALPLLGIGTVYAIKSLTKGDEIVLKQKMAPKDAKKSTELVGIFAPGFEVELSEAMTQYAKEYGEGNFQTLEYNGYILLIPPLASTDGLADAKAQVDNAVLGQKSNMPDATARTLQIAKIREVFGVEGALLYDTVLGAYTDEKGFQYNFENGSLVSKQIGITSILNAKFEQAYPHFKPSVVRVATISSEQAQLKADRVIGKLFASDRVDSLKANVRRIDFGDARVGLVYGSKEIYILIDQVTGDVINFNKAN